MLIYEHNGNVLPLLRELVEGMFDGGVIRLLIHNEEVFLRIRGVGDVLCSLCQRTGWICPNYVCMQCRATYTYSRQKNAGYGILHFGE